MNNFVFKIPHGTDPIRRSKSSILAGLTLALILLLSPSLAMQANAATTLEDHKWTITNIGELKGKHLGFITFSNGQLEGQSTCNSFSAVFQSGDDKSLTIFAIGATQLICEVDDKMKIESAFLADLEAVKRYEISGETLILYKDNDVEIARLK